MPYPRTSILVRSEDFTFKKCILPLIGDPLVRFLQSIIFPYPPYSPLCFSFPAQSQSSPGWPQESPLPAIYQVFRVLYIGRPARIPIGLWLKHHMEPVAPLNSLSKSMFGVVFLCFFPSTCSCSHIHYGMF